VIATPRDFSTQGNSRAVETVGRLLVSVIQKTVSCVTFASIVVLIADAGMAPLMADFELAGSYTQNIPCKGDGTDPKESRVKISPEEIVSKVGVCAFLDKRRSSNSVVAHVECHFPAGPLTGEIIFRMRPDDSIDFTDRDGNYRAVLFRCPSGAGAR
jgi:hypothetical protein